MTYLPMPEEVIRDLNFFDVPRSRAVSPFAVLPLPSALLQASPDGAVDPLYLWIALFAVVVASGLAIWAIIRGTRRRELRLRGYRNAFDSAAEPVLLLDDDLTILEANDAAAAMLGQTTDRLRRTRLLNWISPDVEDDQASRLQSSLTELGRASFWSTVTTSAGTRNVDVRLSRSKPMDGVPPVMIALLYDISDYREEGRLFKTLHERMLANIPIEVTVLSPQGEYLHISPSTMGDPAVHDWTIGKTDVEFCQRMGLHPEVALRRRAFRRQAVNAGKVLSFEEEITMPDGQKRYYTRWYNPVTREKAVYAVVSYAIDRTDVRRLQEEVDEARLHAGERERLREAIMANLSHEFRTPLTGILGAAQILNYEVSDQGQEFVDMIESAGRRLMNTLNSLLDLAGLRDGGLDVHPRVLDLAKEVQSVGAAFAAEAESRGLFLRTKVPDEDVWVRLDQGHLFRILQHLVSNAIKFTESGGVVLEVTQDDDTATVRVMDTGVGIDEEYLRTLFDEFQQESLGLARAFEGVGVGLAVTHGLVERMGGTIFVESQKAEGSTFTVSFPRAFRIKHDEESHNARVLLVEPAAEDRRIAEFALREVVDVYATPDLNGSERRSFGPVDAALIAVTGPEVDPGAVVREVRAQPGFEQLPLVALDAYPLPGNRESFISSGFAEYVPKPLNRQVLLDAVSAVCFRVR